RPHAGRSGRLLRIDLPSLAAGALPLARGAGARESGRAGRDPRARPLTAAVTPRESGRSIISPVTAAFIAATSSGVAGQHQTAHRRREAAHGAGARPSLRVVMPGAMIGMSVRKLSVA